MKIYKKNIRSLLALLMISSTGLAEVSVVADTVVADSVVPSRRLVMKKGWKDVLNARSMYYFDRGLMGNEPGVYSSHNGFTGNAGNILLRGITSVNLTTSPYVVVDGMPVRQTPNISPFASGIIHSNLGFVNPLDIATIRMVNNGYDGSFYGGKAGNGIIEIGIDKGEVGSATIDVNLRTGFSKADYSFDMMDPADFRTYLYAMMLGKGITEGELQQNSLFDPAHAKYNHNTNWMDAFRRNGMFNDFQLKMKGGDGDTRYLFSIGYTSDNETIEEATQNRLNMRFNLNYKLTPKIRMDNFFSYTFESSRFLGEGTDWAVNPVYLAFTKAPFMSPGQYSDEGIRIDRLADTDVLGKSNPAVFKNNLKNTGSGNRIDAVIKATWDITRSTSLNTDFDVSYSSLIEKQHRKAQGIVPDRYIDRQNSKRSYSEYLIRWNLWLGRNGNVTEDITYDSRLGFTMESYQEKMIYGRKVNAATDEITSVDGGKLADSVSNDRYQHNMINVYLSGGMYFWKKLSVAANLNLERSSNFGLDGKWNLYAGAHAGYEILKNNDYNLSLYGNWGRTGNHDLRGAYYCKMYKPDKYYYYGGVYLGNVTNNDLKPEITNNYDFGVKTALFDHLVDLSVGYYIRKTKGLLTQKNLPIEIGLDPQFENNGDVLNRGVDISVNVNIVNRKKISWSVFANFSTLHNEITALNNGDVVRTMDKYTGVARKGEELGSFFGYKVKGVYKTTADVDLLRADGTPYLAGDYQMEDINSDGIINASDRQIIGSPLPELYGGFGTHLTTKGWMLSALFTYSYGNDVYNLFDQKLNSMSDFSNQTNNVIGRWMDENHPGKGFLPRAAYGDPSGNFATSDRWVEDGSYLKLSSVSLGYDIPMKNRTGFVKGINISVNCNNLFTVSGYSGLDPEVFSSVDPLLRGVDTGMSPNPRSYIFGLKISL